MGRHVLRWTAAILVVAIPGAIWVASEFQTDRGLRHMPADQRAALYARTYETLSTTCAQTLTPAVFEYCQRQALFIICFPECDAACVRLAQKYLPRPTR